VFHAVGATILRSGRSGIFFNKVECLARSGRKGLRSGRSEK